LTYPRVRSTVGPERQDDDEQQYGFPARAGEGYSQRDGKCHDEADCRSKACIPERFREYLKIERIQRPPVVLQRAGDGDVDDAALFTKAHHPHERQGCDEEDG
jgi:hypothetical protein